MNVVGALAEREGPGLACGADDAAGGAGEPHEMLVLAAVGAGPELRREAGREQQLQAERERAGAAGLRVAGRARLRIEYRELAAEQVEDAGMGLGCLEQAPDGVACARGRVERAGVAAQARVRVDRLRAGDRQQLAASLVQLDVSRKNGSRRPRSGCARA